MKTSQHETTREDSLQQVEEAVVCCLLLNENAILNVSPVLKPEMFYTKHLRFIYEAICSLSNQGIKADLVTTDTEMRKMDEQHFQAINGLASLSDAFSRIRHITNLVHYAEEVKRHYMLRCLGLLFVGLQGKTSQFETSYVALIEEAERSLLELRERCRVGKAMQHIGETATKALALHRERLKTGKNTMRVLTGMEEFDRITGGLHNGELIVEGGRPGDGKSAVAMHIAMNAATAGQPVCFFSLEMTGLQSMNRIFAGYAGVDPAHLRITGITLDDVCRMEKLTGELESLPLYFDYTPANTIENIRAQAHLQVKKGQCSLIVVDYLNEIGYKRMPGETMEQIVSRNIRALKALAVELDRPVLVLSQLNRGSEIRGDKSRLPEVHNLRDSGTIEQEADCVFLVYRPDRHGITVDELSGESLVDVGELLIQKSRNGATGVARYRYNKSYTRITNYRKH